MLQMNLQNSTFEEAGSVKSLRTLGDGWSAFVL
jgi:hypothetical protein